ncbi:MAG: hypothetical protein EH225_06905 [Calditrichaeota bacterium]|nr:MAG: hypothetical protein EH225_06905 [Calditrichota bacterium]
MCRRNDKKGHRKQDSGTWIYLNHGHWLLDAGNWLLVAGCWPLDTGYSLLVFISPLQGKKKIQRLALVSLNPVS